MFGRKRNWRFAKWLSGLDFFIIKSSSEKLPDNFVDLHTVMLPYFPTSGQLHPEEAAARAGAAEGRAGGRARLRHRGP